MHGGRTTRRGWHRWPRRRSQRPSRHWRSAGVGARPGRPVRPRPCVGEGGPLGRISVEEVDDEARHKGRDAIAGNGRGRRWDNQALVAEDRSQRGRVSQAERSAELESTEVPALVREEEVVTPLAGEGGEHLWVDKPFKLVKRGDPPRGAASGTSPASNPLRRPGEGDRAAHSGAPELPCGHPCEWALIR